jgi:glycopeptide antibiotics resistance protein
MGQYIWVTAKSTLIDGFILAVILWLAILAVRWIAGKRIRSLQALPHIQAFWGFALIWYLAVLGILTGPLDVSSWVYSAGSSLGLSINLVPFHGAPASQCLLNILLFVPFGFLLPLVFQRHSWTAGRVFLIVFGLTLAVELSQLAMRVSYRIFDINDLLMNVLGGMLGYGILVLIRRTAPAGSDL